jgi:hypothetical protein
MPFLLIFIALIPAFLSYVDYMLGNDLLFVAYIAFAMFFLIIWGIAYAILRRFSHKIIIRNGVLTVRSVGNKADYQLDAIKIS